MFETKTIKNIEAEPSQFVTLTWSGDLKEAFERLIAEEQYRISVRLASPRLPQIQRMPSDQLMTKGVVVVRFERTSFCRK